MIKIKIFEKINEKFFIPLQLINYKTITYYYLRKS